MEVEILTDAPRSGLPRETHSGILRIGEREIPCSVLDNQMRVISATGLNNAFGQRQQAAVAVGERGHSQLPRFLAAKNLNPLIPADFVDTHNLVRFLPRQGGREAYGFQVDILTDICVIVLRGRRDGMLRSTQEPLADEAEALLLASSRTGWKALVDEAAGCLPQPGLYEATLNTTLEERQVAASPEGQAQQQAHILALQGQIAASTEVIRLQAQLIESKTLIEKLLLDRLEAKPAQAAPALPAHPKAETLEVQNEPCVTRFPAAAPAPEEPPPPPPKEVILDGEHLLLFNLIREHEGKGPEGTRAPVRANTAELYHAWPDKPPILRRIKSMVHELVGMERLLANQVDSHTFELLTMTPQEWAEASAQQGGEFAQSDALPAVPFWPEPPPQPTQPEPAPPAIDPSKPVVFVERELIERVYVALYGYAGATKRTLAKHLKEPQYQVANALLFLRWEERRVEVIGKDGRDDVYRVRQCD